jgi:hypothetical protein
MIHSKQQLHPYFSIFKTWITTYVMTQLIITAVSLPFLISWGIPFSAATIVGNLIFTPFITLFLLVSSLFFICNLFGFAPPFLSYCLEAISNIWLWFLQWGSASWMIAIPHSSHLITGSAIVLLIYLSVTTDWHMLYKKPTLCMSATLMYLLFICIGNSLCNTYEPTTINKKLCIHTTNEKKLMIYDQGFFSSPGSTTGKIEYRLKQLLTQKYGLAPVKTCMSNKLNQKTCEGLAALCAITSVEQIILPSIKQKLDKKFWRTYYHMKRSAKEHGTIIMHSDYARKTATSPLASSPAQKARYTAVQNGIFC